jgi:hypothetical protein
MDLIIGVSSFKFRVSRQFPVSGFKFRVIKGVPVAVDLEGTQIYHTLLVRAQKAIFAAGFQA